MYDENPGTLCRYGNRIYDGDHGESLGLSLPDNACIPAVTRDKSVGATFRSRIVEMVKEDCAFPGS